MLSKAARENGLGTSLIERLFLHYKKHRADKKFASTLLTNYRSHPSILMLASTLLYECRLLSRSTCEAHPLAPYPVIFACSSLQQDGFRNRPAVNETEARIVVNKALEFIESWPSSQSGEKPVVGLLATSYPQVSLLFHPPSFHLVSLPPYLSLSLSIKLCNTLLVAGSPAAADLL